jgi:hypothetical protein
MTPTISIRKNDVYADGNLVGTVEKIVHDGLWATAYGIRAGGTEWKGTATDGTVFDGFDTRKAVANMLARHAQPLTVDNVKVDNWMGERFIYASVSWQGITAIVSQYPTEDFWVVDAFFNAGSMMPAWSNGSGSRSTAAHVLKADQAAAVDAAVEASGITID